MEEEKAAENQEIQMIDLQIGEDKPALGPKRVMVIGVKMEPVNSEGKFVGNKMVLEVNHPDSKEAVKISGVKYLDNKDKVKNSGLWVKLDADNKIHYHSAIAHLLRHYNIKSLKDLRGVQLETCLDQGNYLAIKAY